MNALFKQRFVLLFLGFSIALGMRAPAAIIYVDGDDTLVNANDGVFLTGTDTTPPNNFRTPELIKNQGNETKLSDATVLSTISYIIHGGVPYFQLVYDQQETANNDGHQDQERVIFTELSVYVGPDTTFANALLVWELAAADDVYVNDQNRLGGPFLGTDKPLGEGGDATLNIPFSLFPSGTTSDHFLFFRVTQADADNGGDEWVTIGDGLTLPQATALPEPSTWLLALSGLVCLAGVRMLRRVHVPPTGQEVAGDSSPRASYRRSGMISFVNQQTLTAIATLIAAGKACFHHPFHATPRDRLLSQ